MSKDRTNHHESPPVGGLEVLRLPSPESTTVVAGHHLDPGGLESTENPAPAGTVAQTPAPDHDAGVKAANRSLPSRNIVVYGKRTSVRLDALSLRALYDAADREHVSVNELCTLIQERGRRDGYTLTAAIRIYLLSYFRDAATDEGHLKAGHGSGRPLAGTPFDPAPPAESEPGPHPPRRRRSRTSSSAGTKADGGRRAADRSVVEEAAAG